MVGVATGCLVGYFLVRVAFKRYAAAALEERQIQWNEKGLQTILELRLLAERISLALQQEKTALWQSLKMDINSTLIHSKSTLNEAVIYAERGAYRQLRDSVFRCRTLTDRLVQTVRTESPSQAGNLYVSLLKELDQATFVLVKPLREKLGLDPIRIEDLRRELTASGVGSDRGATTTPAKTH